jgi:hypothetical protein
LLIEKWQDLNFFQSRDFGGKTGLLDKITGWTTIQTVLISEICVKKRFHKLFFLRDLQGYRDISLWYLWLLIWAKCVAYSASVMPACIEYRVSRIKNPGFLRAFVVNPNPRLPALICG